ncbi:GNAT family N-acetyltransferase [Tundrisphaera lichenicola]|uniref:GNAT family N-acetyltransferase n=1 Tax=Tundrisphaera lichenicola TaxID=2029860 RepID=UPI003EB7D6A9
MELTYQLEPGLTPEEFVDLLRRSTLAERRPVDEPETIRGMLQHAGVLVTARAGGVLVGISRAITDFSFCTYLSDLAVDAEYQRQGIGKELIRRTHEAAGLGTTLILLAAPLARGYYPRIGMTGHDSCWVIPRQVPEK